MTCRAIKMHPLDVLYQTCRRYPGGIEALARRLELSEKTLYSKLRHQVDSHHIGYDEELSEILFCLKEANVKGWADTLHALLWRHDHLALPMPNVMTNGADDTELTSAIVASVKEHGEAIASIGEALRGDDDVDDDDLRNIDKEIEEAMAALAALRSLAKRRHEASAHRAHIRPVSAVAR